MKKKIWIPIAIFLLITPFSAYFDHLTSNLFYDATSGFSQSSFFKFIYKWGPIPAWITAIGGVFFLALNRFKTISKKIRHASAVLALVLLLGSGVLANAVFKSYWGRPRPNQVEEFGGNLSYRCFYQPNFANTLNGTKRCRSFPSGHASTGFFFFALIPIGWRFNSRKLVFLGITIGCLLGGVLSLTRIAQGGHFFSDCITSALLMWLVALWCDQFIEKRLS